MSKVNPRLKLGLASCFDSEKYTDFVVKCGDEIEYKVHKVVICSQSDVFEKACSIDMKESAQGAIDLKEDDPLVVQAMLHYMYKSSYDDESGNNPGRCAPLVFNVQVYALADKFQVEGLKDLALKKFEELCTKNWTQEGFTGALRVIYGDLFPPHDTAMRKAAIEKAGDHMRELLQEPAFVKMLEEVASLGSDLTKKFCDKPSKPKLDLQHVKKYRCPSCNRVWHMDNPQQNTTGYCYFCGSNNTWTNYTC